MKTFTFPLVRISVLMAGCFAAVVQARAATFLEIEPNNGFAQAQFLGPHDGTVDLAAIFNGPDSNGFINADFFRFAATAGDEMRVAVRPEPAFANMSLFLYDPDTIFTGVAAFGANPMFEFPVPSTGAYYVSVSGLSAGLSGPYRLSITGLTPEGRPVPEPRTMMLLLGAGLAWVGAAVLRMREKRTV